MTFLDRDKYGMYKKGGSPGPGPALMGADTLMGEDVVNMDEDKLGDIKEIMIDMRSGQVAYAVLAFHGMLGMGEKLFAVPWQALQLDTDKKRFVVNIDKDRLKSAPGFNPDAWPDMDDVNWAAQINTFYGVDLSRGGSMGMNMPGSMVAGAGIGAGAGSMGAGHAGTGAGAGTGGPMGGAGTLGGDTLGGSTTGGGMAGGSALGGSTSLGGSTTLGGAAQGTTGSTLDNGSSSGISGTGLNKDNTGGGGGL
jgi:sporulation protein YlmC with PRC-barrel domain